MNIDIKIVWDDDDDKDNKRPEKVTVTVYEVINGTPVKVRDIVVEGVTDKDKDTWTDKIKDLPVYKDGEKNKKT